MFPSPRRISLRRIAAALAISLALASVAVKTLAEDLLSDDEFSFDVEQNAPSPSVWPEGLELTAEHLFSQGDKSTSQRSSVGLEFEATPWKGGFLRFENSYRYYWRGDVLARRASSEQPYGRNKLSELWLQQSNQDCYIKSGRQTLFWGAVEGTFAVDQVTPFDYTESLFTDYSNIRRPQDMLLGACFYGQSKWQAFVTPRATLSRISHRDTFALDQIEDELNEELGASLQQSFEGLDVTLLYARLYANTPVTVLTNSFPPQAKLAVARYDLVGLSVVKAIGRLLLEMDLGYKRDQIIAISGELEDQLEVAAGFEYTTAGNHQLNAGIWSYKLDRAQLAKSSAPSTDRVEQFTAGWSKTYDNDDLTMSLLGSWLAKHHQSRLTVHARYQIDDYWQCSTALSYTETGDLSASNLVADGWEASMGIKIDI
jgi:hypothetical protein